MKKNLFLLLSLFIYMQSFSQSDVATARWMNKPVIIDGINNEWGELNFYDDETHLNFAIANDSDKIYLCFGTTSDPDQMKLLRAGMKIILSTKGKQKHEASILFPLPQTKEAQPQEANDSKDSNYIHPAHNRESFREHFMLNHSTMEVDGFATINGIMPIRNTGIQAAINWDSASNVLYEVAIAKKEFFGTGYTAKEMLSDITLTVEINGLSRSQAGGGENRNGYQNNGTHGSEMHGGMHGGGTHGGFNGGKYGSGEAHTMNNTNNVSLTAKTSFKQKFVLNNNSN